MTSRFVEQAEYIDKSAFELWSASHPNETAIIKKLCAVGAKLITGPRGCGKTTLLLKSYNKMLSASSSALPVYANFKTSLKIEPLYHKNANAKFLFNQWLIIKIILGVIETLEDSNISEGLPGCPPKAKLLLRKEQLEMGSVDDFSTDDDPIDLNTLQIIIAKAMERAGRKRCVLLLDDAAHAFSAEQQRDFFDFFRRIKSREVSPKAAIYPGVTVYSSSFHVGHDAEEIDVWVRPTSDRYVEFMTQLLHKRLGAESFNVFLQTEDLLELLCYSSFGIPRSLLNSARSILGNEESDGSSRPEKLSRKRLNEEIKGNAERSMALYSSLKLKLPIYETFISEGERIFRRGVEAIKSYNKDKSVNRKSVDLALKHPLPTALEKTLAFMEYAGIISSKGKVSRGVKGVFQLYTLHYGILIDRNALLAARSQNVADLVSSLKHRNAHEFTRVSTEKILGNGNPDEVFHLSLPPCEVCGAARQSEEAKFCMHCGSKLKTASTFLSIVNQGIENLPLTEQRVRKIKRNSSIRKIKDILVDQGHNRLRRVPMIGPVWAKRIHSYAEEYIA